MIPVNVNIAIDVTAGFLSHNLLLPPPAVPPPKLPIVPAVEMVATQMWTAGYFTGQNKLTNTVKHRSLPIMLEGHDIGMLIPDVTIPPTNLWYAVMWPFSSRKVSFLSSSVKMDKKATGCALAWLPMMTCGDPVTAPTSAPLTNWLQTVYVGMSPLDLLAGIGAICFSVGLDLLFHGLSMGSTGPGPSSAWSAVGQGILGKIVPTSPADWAKKALSGLTGVLFPSPTDGPKYEVKVGIPGVSEAGVAVTGTQASAGRSVFGGADNRGGFGASAEGGVRYGDDRGTRGYGQAQAGGDTWSTEPPAGT